MNRMDPEQAPPERMARCLLCGDLCWFDDRAPYRVAGLLVLLVGWAVPFGLAELLDRNAWGVVVGLLGGGLVWLAIAGILLFKQTAWVCRTCGAFYPARRVAEGDPPPPDGEGTAGTE